MVNMISGCYYGADVGLQKCELLKLRKVGTDFSICKTCSAHLKQTRVIVLTEEQRKKYMVC